MPFEGHGKVARSNGCSAGNVRDRLRHLSPPAVPLKLSIAILTSYGASASASTIAEVLKRMNSM